MIIESNNGRLIEIHNFIEPTIMIEFIMAISSERERNNDSKTTIEFNYQILDDSTNDNTVATFAIRNHFLTFLNIRQENSK